MAAIRMVSGRQLEIGVMCCVATFLAGCATQAVASAPGAPGFFSGLLHGFLILFTLIGSIFTDYRIYAHPNSGGWYDLGYFMGACIFLGGGSQARRRKVVWKVTQRETRA